MNKPKLKIYKMYNYSEMRKYIEKKYKCDIRNFAGKTYTQNENLPYLDFWHFLLDCIHIMGTNCFLKLSWKDIRERAKEDGEEWAVKICDMFIKEFGNKPMYVDFSW